MMIQLRITNVELRKSGIRNQELGISVRKNLFSSLIPNAQYLIPFRNRESGVSGRKNLLSTLIPNAQYLMPFMTFQRVEAQ